MIKFKTIVFGISVLLNLLFVFFLVSAIASKTSSVAYYSIDDAPSITAASIVSVPAGAGSVTFNAVEIELPAGQSAMLQFSGVIDGKQANWIIETLFDRGIVDVQKNGYGILITALRQGEAVLQTLTEFGIRDIAVVRVTK